MPKENKTKYKSCSTERVRQVVLKPRMEKMFEAERTIKDKGISEMLNFIVEKYYDGKIDAEQRMLIDYYDKKLGK